MYRARPPSIPRREIAVVTMLVPSASPDLDKGRKSYPHIHDVSIVSFMRGAASDLRGVLGDTFTYGAARNAGVSDKRLYRLRDSGEVVALGGGVYRWSGAVPADDDLVEIAERVPRGTLCLETALARHGLIDAIPAAIDVAVPRGSTRPALRAPVRLHQFDLGTFDLGRGLLDVSARRPLGLYSAERSIIDAVRLRHREGSDMAWEALRQWLARPGRSPAQLIDLAARIPRAEPALRHALEILL